MSGNLDQLPMLGYFLRQMTGGLANIVASGGYDAARRLIAYG